MDHPKKVAINAVEKQLRNEHWIHICNLWNVEEEGLYYPRWWIIARNIHGTPENRQQIRNIENWYQNREVLKDE